MNLLKSIIVILVVVQAGWMAFDGGHALVRGDYVTPRSGPHAGELGSWSRVLAAAGIEPRSTPVKTAFLVYGIAWLAFAVAFAAGIRWSWWALVAAALGSLWYLPIGTGFALAQLVLLMLPQVRS